MNTLSVGPNLAAESRAGGGRGLKCSWVTCSIKSRSRSLPNSPQIGGSRCGLAQLPRRQAEIAPELASSQNTGRFRARNGDFRQTYAERVPELVNVAEH